MLTLSPSAQAQPAGCSGELQAWVRQCARTEQVDLKLDRCPTGQAVVKLNGQLDIEISSDKEDGFLKVGELGLSPIAEIADWSREPEARKRGLSALAACVERSPPTLPKQSAPRRPLAPWLLVVAALVGLIASRKPRGGWKKPAAIALLGVVSCGMTVLVRGAVMPEAFFHQNGHGARWIQIALSGGSEYGPGFAEVFGWVAQLSWPASEAGVFSLQAVLAGTAPLAVYATCRALGAAPALSLAWAFAVAVEPVLARISRSESYFSTVTSLSFVAVALLCVGLSRAKLDRRAVLFCIAAGVVLAQALRVHPLGWVPLSFAPAVALLGPGSMKRRARATIAAYAIVGAVVLVTSGGTLLQVLQGELGQSWMPRAGFRSDTLGSPMVIVSVLAAAVPLLVLRNPRGVVFFILGGALAAVAAGTDMLSKPNPAVDAASVRAYFPVALSLAMAGVIRVLRPLQHRLRLGRARPLARRLFALPVLGIGALTTASWALRFEQLAALPTDSLEAQHFIQWRQELPLDADVRYLARAGSRLLVLPLYTRDGVPRARPLADGAGLPAIKKRPLFYYRSSMCSTPEGRASCTRHQESARLQLVAQATLPARSSMRWDGYAASEVQVALYRVVHHP